ncbi:MAG: hypothetical protein NVS3B10_28860 [Polyangiales bacterium]
MTKAEIVNAVYSKVGGFSKKEAADIVELVFETVKETLGRGEKIKISGFGNFVLRDKRQRRGRNPQTGEPLTITERRVLTFKASQILKSILNPEHAGRDDDAASEADGHGQAHAGSAAAEARPNGGATGAAHHGANGSPIASSPAAARPPLRTNVNQGERR